MEEIIKKRVYHCLLFLIIAAGVFFRLNFYISNGILEDDECRMAVFMYNKNLLEMFLPLGPLSSSPIFLFFSKIAALITDYNEHALKTLPLLFSLGSVYMFYKLTVKYYKHRFSIILANFIFAFNSIFVYYAGIFKQYSLEYFLSIVLIYFLPEVKLDKLNIKQTLLFSFLMILCVLSSTPSVFIIGCFVLINIFNNLKNSEFYKKLFIFLIPFCTVTLLYYIFNLAPTQALQMKYYSELWSGVYSTNVILAFLMTLRFTFQSVMIIIPILMIIAYYINFLLEKSFRNKYDIYLALTILSVVILHILNLYPLYRRAFVFVIPIVLLIIIKPIDYVRTNKKLFYAVIFISSVLFFGQYFLPKNFVYDDLIIYSPKNLMQETVKNYNPDTDVVITNEASVSSFMFYARKMNFNPSKIIILTRLNQLNALENDKNYWLYLVKDFENAPVLLFIQKWLEEQNISYTLNEKRSYLYYIKPPYKPVRKDLFQKGQKYADYITKKDFIKKL